MRLLRSKRRLLLVPVLLAGLALSGVASLAIAACGPFSDVGAGICPFVVSMYYLGITAGTTATTYSPGNPVTRGQMAIFMGALFNLIKRTENPYRLATGMHGQAFNFNYADRFETGNTNVPIGFATDGFFNYVASASNNKIDMFYKGNGHRYVTTLTTISNNGPMVCDGNYLFITSFNGTSMSRYQIRTGTLTDPWVTGLSGMANDVAIAADKIIVANTGGVDIVALNGGVIEHSNALGYARGIAYMGDGTFWVAIASTLLHMDLNAAILGSANLTNATSGHQVAFDGQNVWVPLINGDIDVVATRGAQQGAVVDTFAMSSFGATYAGGITFTGQWIVASGTGDFGCGSSSTIFGAIDPATHVLHESVGQCGSGSFIRIGFDGEHVWPLGSDQNIIYVE